MNENEVDINNLIPNIPIKYVIPTDDGIFSESVSYRGHIDCWIDGKKVTLSRQDQDRLMDYRDTHGEYSDELLDEILSKYRSEE